MLKQLKIPFLLIAISAATIAATTQPSTQPATAPTTHPAENIEKDRIAVIDMVYLETNLDLFQTDTGRFPTETEGLDALLHAPKDISNWGGPYVRKIPKDPWGHAYIYHYPPTHNKSSIDILSPGPDGKEGTPDDIVNWIEKK